MSRFASNTVGFVGLIACAAIGLLDSVDNTWVLGPQLAISNPRLDATLASHLAVLTSEGTIKNRVSSILSKLGVRNRVRAALRGLKLGYIYGLPAAAAYGHAD